MSYDNVHNQSIHSIQPHLLVPTLERNVFQHKHFKMTSFQPIFKITPGVQSYDWGKIGSTSLAAQFGERCIQDFKTDDNKPYAEVSSQSLELPRERSKLTMSLSVALDGNPRHPPFLPNILLPPPLRDPQILSGEIPRLFHPLQIPQRP